MFLEIILGNIRGMVEGILGEINIVSGKCSQDSQMHIGSLFHEKIIFFQIYYEVPPF